MTPLLTIDGEPVAQFVARMIAAGRVTPGPRLTEAQSEALRARLGRERRRAKRMLAKQKETR